ncbi:hypothetical protein LELG_00938 [Lodderomyces elongisporus NRRL YB-4239]|uniref:Uncharacterized protein n=1 Tax=Lodderomyces elongisporus (strain ATCC 11503 / CBS 2605 / JCM 1781 / NBRC 1676 / NRRL YB-4239) TaxID=379508 RepID=A5DUA2_LODEL|nr:hypothetical protein LELG_00938 [Lodderomyces elongisporus NRRL YB-4239]
MDAVFSGTKVTDKGRIAGITVGAASGCLVYMSLMVLLFRKFRKNNKNLELPLTDSESSFGMSSDDYSSYSNESGSGFSAIFARLNNNSNSNSNGTLPAGSPTHPHMSQVRAGNISQPVQASNSLGWYS